MNDSIFNVQANVFGSQEWQEIEKREYLVGPDVLLDELLEKKTLSNAEMMWMLKRLLLFYGKRDELLKKAPPERLMLNMTDILRVLYLLIDHTDPLLDENTRSYISVKLSDSTWGVNRRTREYLYKLRKNE